MRFAILLIFTILLNGCARETPVSDTIADNAVNATTALQQALPDECKTAAINTQFDVIRTEIRAVKTACQTEKDVITSEKLKWQWAFWALAAMVSVYFARKILK